MSQLSKESSHAYWNNVHNNYDRNSIKVDNWLERFEELLAGATKPILDLGCGGGNDTLYMVNKGKSVIACDQSENAIKNIIKNFPEVKEARCFNMLEGLPFENGSFEVIIADLCLHYFDSKDTAFIIEEIRRVLAPGGHLLFRVNSVNDVNHGFGQGKELSPHLYEMDDHTIKRFFDEEDIRLFWDKFDIEYMNEEIMTRYSLPKNLFTVCVRKI